MKKFLTFALVIVLVLALGAGCNQGGGDDEPFDALGEIKANSDIMTNDDGPSDDGTADDDPGGGDTGPSSGGASGWPASDLPPGLPIYPDGEVSRVDNDAMGVFVVIDGTSAQSLAMYKTSMENEGWRFLVENSAKKDRYIVALSIIDSTSIGILAKESDTESSEPILVPTDWPADIPAYPDGNDPKVELLNTGSIFIKIANTSVASLGKYADTLTAEGWTTSLRANDDMKMIFDKIDEKMSLAIDVEDGGTTVSMSFRKLN